MTEVRDLWDADDSRLSSLRDDYLDAFQDDECSNLELSEVRDEYLSTLGGLIDSYSALLVDASPAVREELDEIIAYLANDREEVLGGSQVFGCPPVEYVRICDAFGAGHYYIPGTDTCLNLSGEVRFEYVFLPEVDTGTLITGPGPDNEIGFNTSDERVFGTTGRFGTEFGTGAWVGRISASYGWFEGESRSEEPIGGRPVAITFFGDALSTGIALGPTGATSKSTVEGQIFGVDVSVLAGDFFGQGSQGIRIGPSFSYRHFGQDHSSLFRSLTFADVSSTTDQSVTDDQFGAGATIEATFPLSSQFSIHGALGVKGIYNRTELDSRQTTECGGCPPAVQLVEIETNDEESQFTWSSNFAAGMDIRATPRLTFGIKGTADFTPRAAIDNPENPAQEFTHTDIEHGVDLGLTVGLKYQFGAPLPPPPPAP